MSNDNEARLALAWVRWLIGLPRPCQAIALRLLALHNRTAAALAREMLDSREPGSSILDAPAHALLLPVPAAAGPASVAALQTRIGQRIGAWQIVSLLGAGGMGVVYQARRWDGTYQREVALKFIGSLGDDVRVRNAFMIERNALARLNHRDIVPILDSGVDDDGTPWFAMPLVEGIAIDRWCDDHRVDVRGRIRLIIDVCDALGYAHSRGVLHQDIKPTAILVDGEGKPKLLDFGLADIVNAGTLSSGDSRQPAYSPGFGAPELLSGASPSVAIDVFGIGALISFLLCGSTPTSALPSSPMFLPGPRRWSPLGEIAMTVGNDVLAARNCTSRRKLRQLLDGDLDAIVRHCMDPDPERRYPHLDSIKDDLTRWLERRPVSLNGGILHRIRLFLRRNALSSAIAVAGTIIVAVLALTAAVKQYELKQAQEVSGRADQIISQSLGSAVLSQRQARPLTPSLLLERTESHLRRHASGDSPDVLARGLSILARSQTDAGNYPKAESLAAESLRLGSGAALQFAFNQETLARLHNLTARHQTALHDAQRGLQQLRLCITRQEKVAQLQLRMQLSIAQEGLGETATALATLNAAIGEATQLRTAAGNIALAQMLIVRGGWYRRRLMIDESRQDLERAVALARQTDPRTVDDARESLIRTTRSSRLPDRDGRALTLASTLLESRQHTLGLEHPLTGVAWGELAFMQMLNDQRQQAQTSTDTAEQILRSTLGVQHPAYARVMVAQAHLFTFAAKIEQAIAHTGQALAILEKSYGKAHELSLEARFLLANQYWWRSRQDPTALSQAMALMDQSITLYQQRNGEVPALHRAAYSDLLAEAGRSAQALEQIALAKRDALRQYGAASEEMLHIRSSEIDIRIASGAAEDFLPALDALVADTRRIDSLYARSIEFSALLSKGGIQREAADRAGARASFVQARDIAGRVAIDAWVQRADSLIQSLGATAQ